MTRTIRWGILGAARFARDHMAPAIHAAEGAEFAALATADAARAAPFRALNPALRLHDSYDRLLADPGIDAVYIPLPNHLHVEWTLRAIAAGKHVLTEKPVALTAQEIDGLIHARDAAGLVVAEAYMVVHHPQWRRARELVQSGAIGALRQVDAVFSYDNRADPGNIRNRPETGGGGVRDIGVYPYGCARFVTGAEPETVEARLQRENGVDVWAQATGLWAGPGGRFAFSAVTSMRQFPRQEMTFHGDRGLIRLTAPWNPNVYGEARLDWHQPGHLVLTDRWPGVNHYKLQVEAFGRSVRDGAPYPCPLEFSRGTQAMIDRVLAQGVEIAF